MIAFNVSERILFKYLIQLNVLMYKLPNVLLFTLVKAMRERLVMTRPRIETH